MGEDFTWVDGERLIRFGAGALEEAPGLLEQRGFDGYALLTTERAAGLAPALVEGAAEVVEVPAGKVDEVSAGIHDEVGGRPPVAVGGGRVVDSAKAIAGADGTACAAVPTTLSGAEMTPFHRTPAGAEAARLVRPALVVAEPGVMASQPATRLAASAMNALAHAIEALYAPLVNPVAELAALRAIELIGAGLPREEPDRDGLALGAVVAGYAVGQTGFAVHHAVCQTIVRVTGSPHAETNAVMLPHFAELMVSRAPGEMGEVAEALGDPEGAAEAAPGRISKLSARCGHTRLATLGVSADQLPEVVQTASRHPALANTPDPPDTGELLRVLQAAL